MRTPAYWPLLIAAILILQFCGCSEENSVEPPNSGTIAIVLVPEGMSGPWQISGPGGFNRSGTGAAVLNDVATGEYTLSWGEVADWASPYPETSSRTLSSNGTLMFTGIWIAGAGNVGGFVPVPAGSFVMGSPVDEPHRFADLETQHRVTLTRAFSIQVTEVTYQNYADLAQWACDNGLAAIDGDSIYDTMDGSTVALLGLGGGTGGISYREGRLTCENPDHPVTTVSWYGAVAYCDWRSLKENLVRAYDHETWRCNGGAPYDATGYRLPTEAEWEYACRAGSTTAFANGSITNTSCEPLDGILDGLGWYCGNSGGVSHRIAEKNANAWGLYDMHGNVLEWCNDWMSFYGGAETDPVGPPTAPQRPARRVARGGGWYYYSRFCRSAYRNSGKPDHVSEHVGFRCVITEPRR